MDKKPAQPKEKPAVVNTEVSAKEIGSARQYIFLMVGIMAVMVIVGGIAIYYLATTYSREANKIKAQDQEISLLTQKQQNLGELQPNYTTITAQNGSGPSDAQLILQALPTTADFKALIASLEKMGQQSGVKILSVSQSTEAATSGATPATTSDGKAQNLNFTVSIEGPYAGLLDFLKKTEQSSRVINFASMTLNGGTGQAIQANLTMQTYWQGPANIEPTQEPLK